MNLDHLRIRDSMHAMACPGSGCHVCQENERREDALLALLRRDWAARVLTEQAMQTRMNVPQIQRDAMGKTWTLFVHVGDEREGFTAPHPEAAQLAAARAVFPHLSEATRATLGECP